MKLYIKVIDGQTVGNPAIESNLLQAFPDGIPAEFEPFERIQNTEKVKFTQKAVVSYVKNEAGVWYDSWSIVDLTEEELTEKTTRVTTLINNELNFRKTRCLEEINHCISQSDLNGAQVWEEVLSRHNNWVLQSFEPTIISSFSPPFPNFPIQKIATNEWSLLPQ